MPDDYQNAYRGATVCVTGGAGFIGSHLATALAGQGARVRVLDDLSTGTRANLAHLKDDVELIEASILDTKQVERAVAGASVVFHEAAIASVPRSVREPALYEGVNVAGTVNVLEAARNAGVGSIVFASSSSIYGDQPTLPKIESMRLDPRSPYAASKCAGEHFVTSYARCYGMNAVSLRYFNVFGARQAIGGEAAVIPRFAEALCAGRPVEIYGDGRQTRDFTHVDNVVRANLLAGASPTPIDGAAVNVAAGEARSVLDLLHAMADHLGVEPRADHRPERAGDVRDSWGGMDAARDLLGFEIIEPFAAGLARTVDHYAAHFQAATG